MPGWEISSKRALLLEVPGWPPLSAEDPVRPAGHLRELEARLPGRRQAQRGDGECEVQLVREEAGGGV